MATDCIFCKIVDRSIPTELVHSDEHCIAFRDIHPQAPTHLLVVTRLHVRDLPELCTRDADGKIAGHLLRVVSDLAKMEGLLQNGFRVVVNTGLHGGQSVFHLHLHILGQRPLGWPPG